MLVLGVDPGSRTTGYGLLRKEHDRFTCVHSGHISAPGSTPFYERIHTIFEAMGNIMAEYRPREMAIEDVFYGKNIQSALKLGHARGAVLIAAVECGVRIFEYTPLQIKKAVVGYGRATKEQVRSMVRVIARLDEVPNLDTSDAIAAAICHLNFSRFQPAAGRRRVVP